MKLSENTLHVGGCKHNILKYQFFCKNSHFWVVSPLNYFTLFSFLFVALRRNKKKSQANSAKEEERKADSKEEGGKESPFCSPFFQGRTSAVDKVQECIPRG